MELLNKPHPHDLAAYAVAYLFLILTGALGALAAFHLRLLGLALAITGGAIRWIFPLIDRLATLLPLFAWVVLMLVVEHNYRNAVTAARIRSARAPLDRAPGSRIRQGLERRHLDLLIRQFLVTMGALLLVFAGAYGARWLVTTL